MNALIANSLLFAQEALPRHDQWTSVFFGLDPDKRFVLLIVAIGCGTGVIISVIGMVTSMMGGMHRRRLEAEMKREMIERGLSAEEISTIIGSTAPPEDAVERAIVARAAK